MVLCVVMYVVVYVVCPRARYSEERCPKAQHGWVVAPTVSVSCVGAVGAPSEWVGEWGVVSPESRVVCGSANTGNPCGEWVGAQSEVRGWSESGVGPLSQKVWWLG